MQEYINIGKIDKSKIGKYAEKIITDEVILTNERLQHILDNHKKDFELYFNIAKEIIEIVSEVLETREDYIKPAPELLEAKSCTCIPEKIMGNFIIY